uniref:Uncharacterized protein n=1 Tax=Arundo donax TaxID=35708 RepID=A0A0A8ZZ94_ARUDO
MTKYSVEVGVIYDTVWRRESRDCWANQGNRLWQITSATRRDVNSIHLMHTRMVSVVNKRDQFV